MDTQEDYFSNENDDQTDDEEDDWFGSFGADLIDDDVISSEQWIDSTIDSVGNVFVGDLSDLMERLGCRFDPSGDRIQNYQKRTRLVEAHMGSLALCRGERGEELREAGAISALLSTLEESLPELPSPTDESADERDEATVLLASASWGAVRDLSCGSSLNRSAVRNFEVNGIRGLQLLATYLKMYHRIAWGAVSRPAHLRLLTNIIGAMRNVTHSTPENCLELHQNNVTDMLIWRLLPEETSSLPDLEEPWREAAFRTTGTLINMAEKCPEVSRVCGRNPNLIRILTECWGGEKSQLVHLGLLTILRTAKNELPVDKYDESWDDILEKEERRKRYAQRQEEQRKERMLRREERERGS